MQLQKAIDRKVKRGELLEEEAKLLAAKEESQSNFEALDGEENFLEIPALFNNPLPPPANNLIMENIN
jgi:hypothetical protein